MLLSVVPGGLLRFGWTGCAAQLHEASKPSPIPIIKVQFGSFFSKKDPFIKIFGYPIESTLGCFIIFGS